MIKTKMWMDGRNTLQINTFSVLNTTISQSNVYSYKVFYEFNCMNIAKMVWVLDTTSLFSGSDRFKMMIYFMVTQFLFQLM